MKNRQLLIPFLIVLTNQMGAGALLPVLAIYVEGQMGATTLQAMLAVTLFYMAQFISTPFLGKLSDQLGRRPVLIVSQIGTVLAYILIYFALPLGTLFEDGTRPLGLSVSLLILFAARLLDGVTGGNISVAQAYVSDVSDKETRTQALGMIGGATGLGYVLGPVLGGSLTLFGIRAPFIGATLITATTLILTIFFLKNPNKPHAIVPTQAAKSRAILPIQFLILTVTFVSIMAFSALQNIFPLYGGSVLFTSEKSPLPPLLLVGLMQTFAGLVIAISQIKLLKPLVQRFSESNLIILGNGLMALSAFTISLTSSISLLLISFIPFGLGYAISSTCLQSLISLSGDEHRQGQLLGWSQASISLAYISGPLWAGIAYTRIGYQSPFLAAGGLFLLAALMSVPLWKINLNRNE